MRYAIEFDYGVVHPLQFAGMHKGTLGFAPSLESALVWDNKETAERMLVNGYGKLAEFGRVIEVAE